MALEVVVVRRDGFEGEIELVMEGLPEGMTAQGLKIPEGKTRGMMLVSVAQNAPRAIANAKFYGKAVIGGESIVRPCRLASMAWPIPDAWGEIPFPRLLTDVPVSIGGYDFAPITIAPVSNQVVEAMVGEKVTIPLKQTIRSEFSGATMQLRSIGAGFEHNVSFDVSLTSDTSEAVLDLGKFKTPPGNYLIAFYGSAVTKYRHQPEAIAVAEALKAKADAELTQLNAELKKLMDEQSTTATDKKAELDVAISALKEKQKLAAATLSSATSQVQRATAAAQPRDIVDIVVSEPIAIHVKSAGSK